MRLYNYCTKVMTSFTSSTIEVLVGKDSSARKFVVHEALIVKKSEFFKRAVKKAWNEGGTRPITMPEDDPSVFNLYFDMSYSGIVATKTSASPDPDEWSRLTRLYILSEKLQNVWAKNRVVSAMHFYLNDVIAQRLVFFGFDSIAELYDGTPSGSPARKLIVDFYIHMNDQNAMNAGRDVLPIDFVFDIACLVMAKAPPQRGFGANTSLPQQPQHYHETFPVVGLEAQN